MEQNSSMYRDLDSILISREQIQEKVKELGVRITCDYQGKNIVAVCILKGAIVFFTDLIRCIDLDVCIDFMAISSYGSTTKSSGVVKLVKDLDNNITGRDVIIVEDIIDSGLTLKYLKELLMSRKPRSIKTVCLLDKVKSHPADIGTDMKGFDMGDEFVVGYGLDFADYYRNLPYIGVLKEKCYK